MNVPANEPWLERSLALLDQSVDAIDASTLSRLARARQHALARRHSQRRIWIGFGAVGAAAVLVLAFGMTRHAARPGVAPTPVASARAQADDIAIDDDNAELYDDLDFYAWLDAQTGDERG